MRHLLFIFLAALVPFALFASASDAQGWPPQLMAADSVEASLVTAQKVTLSRSGRWVVIKATFDASNILVDREHPSVRRKIGAGVPVFSRDESLLAMATPAEYQKTKVRVSIRDLRTHKVRQMQAVPMPDVLGPCDSSVQDGAFSPDNTTFTTLGATTILRWNVTSGKLLFQRKGCLFSNNMGLRLFSDGQKIWGSTRESSFIYDSLKDEKGCFISKNAGLLPDRRFYYASPLYGGGSFWINRVSDGQEVFRRPHPPFITFTPDGRWMLVAQERASEQTKVELVEVGTWRVVAECQITEFKEWMFDDANHLLTLDQQNRVYRWRLR